MRRRTAWPLLLALSALDGRRVAAEDTTEAAYQAAFTAKLNKQLREQQVLLRDKLNEAREALKAAVAANSPDVKRAGATSSCIPDASTVLKNLSCTTGWLDQAVAQQPRAKPIVHVQVGLGMGYGLANFLALWADPSLTPQKWHKKLMQYGNRNTGRLVRRVRAGSCGDCGQCRAKQVRTHTRKGAKAHVLEADNGRRAMARSLLKVAGFEKSVTVHPFAGTNYSGKLWPEMIARNVADGGELRFENGTKSCDGENCDERYKATEEKVGTTTVDDFLAKERLGLVFSVAINVPGFDPLILEGMKKSLESKAVALVEFGVSRGGYWTTHEKHKRYSDRRQLGDVITRMAGYGYTCFWRSARDVVPVSGDCWRTGYDRIRKSSRIACTHEPKLVEIMMKHSANEYRKRTGHLPGELAAKVAKDGSADALLAANEAPPPTCVPFNAYDSTEPDCEGWCKMMHCGHWCKCKKCAICAAAALRAAARAAAQAANRSSAISVKAEI
jgi:hypothetical protein